MTKRGQRNVDQLCLDSVASLPLKQTLTPFVDIFRTDTGLNSSIFAVNTLLPHSPEVAYMYSFYLPFSEAYLYFTQNWYLLRMNLSR